MECYVKSSLDLMNKSASTEAIRQIETLLYLYYPLLERIFGMLF